MQTEQAWERLGIAPGASIEIIREAYRAAVLAVHPDLAPASERAEREILLREVIEAYGVVQRDIGAPIVAEVPVPVPSQPLDEDAVEITAVIIAFVLAAVTFGASLWVATTLIWPRGISSKATAYSFIGLFGLWAILYGILCPILIERGRARTKTI